MTFCEKVGRHDGSGRDLFLLSIPRPGDMPRVISVSTPRFVCLLAWDARAARLDEISAVARQLLDAGAVYVCVWGPGCERVHDIFDEESVGPNPPATTDSVVITTWHRDESLVDTLDFVLTAATPDDRFLEACGATLGIAIGSAQWTEAIRDAFSRPGGSLHHRSAPGG
jgi:hypothetical protein